MRIFCHGPDTENQNLKVSSDSAFVSKLGRSFSTLLTFRFKDRVSKILNFCSLGFLRTFVVPTLSFTCMMQCLDGNIIIGFGTLRVWI